MHSNFKKGICIGCLALGSLVLSIIDARQTNLETDKNNTIFQSYETAPDTSHLVQKANTVSGSATTVTPTVSSSAVASILPSATSDNTAGTTSPTVASGSATSSISPSTTPNSSASNSPLPTVSAATGTSISPTTGSALSVSELYIQYQGQEITSPTVLTKDDFLVTAVMEDNSYRYVTDYTFTSKTVVTEPGETTISIAYVGKTASCQVSYIEEAGQSYYSITFDSQGGSEVPPILSIKPNSTVRLPDNPVRSGYWFRGWYLDNTYSKEFDTNTKIMKDYTLYAKWEKKLKDDQDIMSTYIVYEQPIWFLCTVEIDLSNQSYGVHTAPAVEAISSENIAEAAKNISNTNNYFAFRFDVDDYTFNEDTPLSTTITIPTTYNRDKVRVFYSPDEHHIQGMCHGESNAIGSYTFSAYAPGTYIVMEVPDTEVTASPEPTTKPSITISLASNVAVNGQTVAQLKYHNFNEDVLDPEEVTFIWKSSKPSVATVTQDGVVTGIKKGTATITVTSDDNQFTASAKITVGPKTVKIKKLTLKKTKVTLKKGKTYTIKATISPTNATTKTLKYTSTNKKIATVTSKGKIKALKKGSCTIKVSTTDGSKITKKIKVTVKNK